MRDDELLVEAKVRVAFVSGGRARPIPKPLRIAMRGASRMTRLPAASESCKKSSHELVEARRQGPARLSPRQPEGSADPRGAGADRAEGPRRFHLRGSRALGRRQPGRALSAFPRSRRIAGRRRAPRLRIVRRRRWPRAGTTGKPDPFTAFDRLGKAYLAFARSEPAYYSAMFEAGVPHEADPNLRQASDRAFGVLRSGHGKIASAPCRARTGRRP